MKFDEQSLEYLEGKKFSNSLIVPYNYHQPIPNRVDFLTSLAKGKRVLHLGCLDHLPLIDEKIKRGQWLHKRLTESAAECLGVDIDAETKLYVEQTHGFRNIILGDFTRSKFPEITSSAWDMAILGEILEHIDNPVDYLTAIRSLYSGNIARMIVTVPNAWTQTTMRMANRSAEIINSDHRYWFTPYTLAKVLARAGMVTEEIEFANRVPLSKSELLRARLLRLAGQTPSYNFTFASSIVAIARLKA